LRETVGSEEHEYAGQGTVALTAWPCDQTRSGELPVQVPYVAESPKLNVTKKFSKSDVTVNVTFLYWYAFPTPPFHLVKEAFVTEHDFPPGLFPPLLTASHEKLGMGVLGAAHEATNSQPLTFATD